MVATSLTADDSLYYGFRGEFLVDLNNHSLSYGSEWIRAVRQGNFDARSQTSTVTALQSRATTARRRQPTLFWLQTN